MLVVGRIVERHEVLRQVGRGGMADVWLVRHTVLGALHALKVPRPGLADPDLLIREGRAQAALDHPHTLPVRDVLDVDGMPALLLPWVDGPSLEALLAERPPSPAEAAALLLGIARGLGFAHDRGFVHRDLKPGNVLLHLRHDGVYARIADFGLVKRSDEATSAADGLGTRAWAAPEQHRPTAPVDARADWYSFGLLARVLFTAGRDPGSPLPGPLGPLVAGLLAEAPEDRPSRRDVLDALQTLPRAPLDLDDPLTAWIRDRIEEPPPARSTPSPTRPLIGREALLARVSGLVREHRLVTLRGIGGIGKSRLAAAVADAVEDGFDGVWWCRAESAGAPEALVAAMGRALGVRLGAQADPTGPVGDALWGRGRALVVVDGLAPFADAPRVLLRWMDQAPECTLLVTSPLPTGLAAEVDVEVPPLDPDAARALLVERADVDAAEPALAPLLAALDGNPLAIELAAAQIGRYAPGDLARRVAERLDVLEGPQRSVLAALEGAWARLSAPARTGLVQASAFAGPFTLEAAMAVLQTGAWIDDVVLELVEHGLLERRDGSPLRFSLRRLVRTFVAPRLDDPAVRARHRAWFASRTDPRPDEVDDLERALDDAIEAGDGEAAASIALVAWRRLSETGPFVRGAALLDRARRISPRRELWLAAADAHLKAGPVDAAIAVLDGLRATADPRVAALRGEIRRHQGALPEARAAFEGVLAAGAPPEVEARAAMGLGNVLTGLGALREAGEAFGRALGATSDPSLRATLRLNQGGLALHRGDLDGAERHLTEAIQLHRAAEHPHLVALAEANLGTVYRRRGALERARATWTEAARGLKLAGDRRHLAAVSLNLAASTLDLGRPTEALAAVTDALASFRALGDHFGEALALGNQGIARLALGDLDGARDTLTAAARAHARLGFRQESARWWSYLVEVEAEARDPAAARGAAARALDGFDALDDALGRAETRVRLAALPDSGVTDEELQDILDDARWPPGLRASAAHRLAVRLAPVDPSRARAVLEAGAQWLRAMPDRLLRTALLLDRAEVLSDLGAPDASDAAAIEAEALHAAMALPPEAPLSRRIGST